MANNPWPLNDRIWSLQGKLQKQHVCLPPCQFVWWSIYPLPSHDISAPEGQVKPVSIIEMRGKLNQGNKANTNSQTWLQCEAMPQRTIQLAFYTTGSHITIQDYTPRSEWQVPIHSGGKLLSCLPWFTGYARCCCCCVFQRNLAKSTNTYFAVSRLSFHQGQLCRLQICLNAHNEWGVSMLFTNSQGLCLHFPLASSHEVV